MDIKLMVDAAIAAYFAVFVFWIAVEVIQDRIVAPGHNFFNIVGWCAITQHMSLTKKHYWSDAALIAVAALLQLPLTALALSALTVSVILLRKYYAGERIDEILKIALQLRDGFTYEGEWEPDHRCQSLTALFKIVPTHHSWVKVNDGAVRAIVNFCPRSTHRIEKFGDKMRITIIDSYKDQ